MFATFTSPTSVRSLARAARTAWLFVAHDWPPTGLPCVRIRVCRPAVPPRAVLLSLSLSLSPWSDASPRRAARCTFLFTRPMVGDARDRRRDMSAGCTAAAHGGGSCHGEDVGLGAPRPGDETPRGRRALIVSKPGSSSFSTFSSSSSSLSGKLRFSTARDEGRCAERFPRGLRTEVGVPHARYFIFRPSRFPLARNQPPPRGERIDLPRESLNRRRG